MGRFRLFLIGTAQPLDVDLSACNVQELVAVMSTAKFITGTVAEPDEDGVCAPFLVPTCRIQCVIER